MIVFEMTEAQADELIRDLARAMALLNVARLESTCPYHQRACLYQSRRLADVAHELEELALGRARREGVPP